MVDYVRQAVLADFPVDLGVAAQVVGLAERGLVTVRRDDGLLILARRGPADAAGLSATDQVLLVELASASRAAAGEWQLSRHRFGRIGRRLAGRARAELRAAGLLKARPTVPTKIALAVAVVAGLGSAVWVARDGDGGRLIAGGFIALCVLSLAWVLYDILRQRIRPTAAGRDALAAAQELPELHQLAPLLVARRWKEWTGLSRDTAPDWLTGVPWSPGPDITARTATLNQVLGDIRMAFREPVDHGDH
ncbi:hypothetical protein EV385_0274 [Krasilnikovia cinnamomea]|uniref:Uncharacterized protein n=1 Tax=Krasilnikovia cinnamomea TaxID=349313 RepID=A0A4Q7ZD03_9ACTN|nr:hypothetical protein [Krasilnikovia cinnamomea]RZU48557.1 hypothetical protein EV385_0274 [Krasilnikovia cinnamomea]